MATELKDIILQQQLNISELNAKLEEVQGKYDKLIFEIQDQPHDGTCNVVVNETLKQEIKELKESNADKEQEINELVSNIALLQSYQDKLAKIQELVNVEEYISYEDWKKLKEILNG